MFKLIVLCLALVIEGCADLANLAQTLNERQVQSCIRVTGAYGMFASLSTVTATGGATLEQCERLR